MDVCVCAEVRSTALRPPIPTLSDLPIQLSAPSAWDGPTLAASPSTWVYHLTSPEIAEIDAAISHFFTSGTPLSEVHCHNFPLPELGKRLREIKEELINGKGVVLIRGLPVERYCREEQCVAFMGVGSYLGERVSQNGKGHVLGHVKDLGADHTKPLTRFYTTNQRQRFHSDDCDIVGLLCLQVSEEGGESAVASSATIYNELRKENNGELVKVLFEPFYWDKKGEIAPGEMPYFILPIAFFYDGHVIVRYDRNFLTTLARFKEVPPLKHEQIEALNRLEAMADQVALRMVLRIGDLQFVHNHAILHARTTFQDTSEHTRHLLRLWLSTGGQGGWKLPWDPTGETRKRMGINVKGVPEKVPLEAE